MTDSNLIALRDLLTSDLAVVTPFADAFEVGGRDAILIMLCESKCMGDKLSASDALKLANALSVHESVNGDKAAAERARADVAGWCHEMREMGVYDGE